MKLLNSKQIEYLLIGGWAVGYYGYPRATGDMDIWVSSKTENANKLIEAFKEFGFDVPDLSIELFTKENQITRIGVPPLRIEVLTTISGVTFDDCFPRRRVVLIEDIKINLISLEDLKKNKAASKRYRDLDDLEKL
ncbi:MAG TPA: nucleotidyltransferase [Ignavibacteriaceae bacterium]|nr:nucleotidyltransferase [Ignavibacteriaceae bacterium]